MLEEMKQNTLEEMNPFSLYDILMFCVESNPARQRVRCPKCEGNNLTAVESLTERLPIGDTMMVKLQKLVVKCKDCDYFYESENLDRVVRLS